MASYEDYDTFLAIVEFTILKEYNHLFLRYGLNEIWTLKVFNKKMCIYVSYI